MKTLDKFSSRSTCILDLFDLFGVIKYVPLQMDVSLETWVASRSALEKGSLTGGAVCQQFISSGGKKRLAGGVLLLVILRLTGGFSW